MSFCVLSARPWRPPVPVVVRLAAGASSVSGSAWPDRARRRGYGSTRLETPDQGSWGGASGDMVLRWDGLWPRARPAATPF